MRSAYAKPFENVSPPKSLFQRGKKSAISSRVIEWRMEITLSDKKKKKKSDRPTCVLKKGRFFFHKNNPPLSLSLQMREICCQREKKNIPIRRKILKIVGSSPFLCNRSGDDSRVRAVKVLGSTPVNCIIQLKKLSATSRHETPRV